MRMKHILQYSTKVGIFYIDQSSDGRFHPVYDDESLGSYARIGQATEDLAMNATFSVLDARTGQVLDTSVLGIPEDPANWTRIAG